MERAAEKKLKDDAKSVRLRDRPTPEKEVRIGADPGSIYQMKMTWTREIADCEGSWSWGTERQWSEETWTNTIAPKLNQFDRLKWSEIDKLTSDTGHKLHHNMQTDIICDEAQLRLMEIGKYDDAIFRFRLGNKPRLWGFRVIANFEILWFDPDHKIYPTDRA